MHALNTKRSFYPEKSHVKRAASMVLLSNMANQVKNPFKCHNYTIYVKKNGFCIDDFVEFCRVTERKHSLQGKTS